MKKIKAFTLIEMIITVAMIIILSTISIPIYKSRVNDAINSEGYLLLKNIRDAQAKYFAEYNIFYGSSGYTSYNEVLGINAMLNKYFTSFTLGGGTKYSFGSTITGSRGRMVMSYNKTSSFVIQ